MSISCFCWFGFNSSPSSILNRIFISDEYCGLERMKYYKEAFLYRHYMFCICFLNYAGIDSFGSSTFTRIFGSERFTNYSRFSALMWSKL
jgi:hypothetical protein